MNQQNNNKSAFISGFAAFTVILILSCVGIGSLFTLHNRIQFQVLRTEINDIANIAALNVSVEDLQKLTKTEHTNNEHYKKIITPLTEIHNKIPKILYLYTMAEIDGVFYYILDTAIDEKLQRNFKIEGSDVMEVFQYDQTDKDYINWKKSLYEGKNYIDEEYFFQDGEYILGASVPMFDSNGDFYGFLGVDFDASLNKERKQLLVNTSFGVLALSVIIASIVGWRVYGIRNKLNQVNQELYLQAHTDFLTSAFNRRYYFSQLEMEMKRSLRYTRSLSLLMLDIDHFKKLNDKYGHISGDKVLVELVKVAKQNMRTHDLIARLGGEEFSILLPETKIADAETFAKHLQKTISQLIITSADDEELNFTISIGISEYQKDMDLDAWVHKTDKAMYQAKEAGRDQVICV